MLIIDKPVITEKSLGQAQNNVYTFAISDGTTKPEIAKAVAKIYGVTVTLVRVASVKGKVVRRKTGLFNERNWKKAYVTIKTGQKIKDFDLPEQKADDHAGHDHNHDHKDDKKK